MAFPWLALPLHPCLDPQERTAGQWLVGLVEDRALDSAIGTARLDGNLGELPPALRQPKARRLIRGILGLEIGVLVPGGVCGLEGVGTRRKVSEFEPAVVPHFHRPRAVIPARQAYSAVVYS